MQTPANPRVCAKGQGRAHHASGSPSSSSQPVAIASTTFGSATSHSSRSGIVVPLDRVSELRRDPDRHVETTESAPTCSAKRGRRAIPRRLAPLSLARNPPPPDTAARRRSRARCRLRTAPRHAGRDARSTRPELTVAPSGSPVAIQSIASWRLERVEHGRSARWALGSCRACRGSCRACGDLRASLRRSRTRRRLDVEWRPPRAASCRPLP